MPGITPTYQSRMAEQQLPGLIKQYTDTLETLINHVEKLLPFAKPEWESQAEYEADLKSHLNGLSLINAALRAEQEKHDE
jgi:hypothetical protein